MTPLAMEIVKDLTRPVKDRSKLDHAKILPRMADVHCFEVSEIIEEARELGRQSLIGRGLAAQQTFLPAARTWIEYKNDFTKGDRVGILLEELPGKMAGVSVAYVAPGFMWVTIPLKIRLWLGWSSDDPKVTCPVFASSDGVCSDDEIAGIGAVSCAAFGCLAFINSPQVISRRQHMPHKGLERDLLKQQKVIGGFPLNAWTEIILDVSPPKEADGQHDYEAHLTGTRALHFVRAHLRIRDGKLQFVKSHWRGDAAVGIKQSRYRVAGQKGL
jgi:hypothetical protein